MPINAHVQIEQTVRQTDVAQDKVENSIFLTTQAAAAAGADWQALADKVRDIWFDPNKTGTAPFTRFGNRGGRVFVYDMADAKPRPEKAVSLYGPAVWASTPTGPRQVALCLSFYSGRNLPTSRGRVFLGPWDNSDMEEHPTSALQQSVMDVGDRLYALATNPIGGLTWTWAIHSQKENAFKVVTNYWCNDVWDTQRRRLSKEAGRLRKP